MIDAVIGLSVVYKGFDNSADSRLLEGFQPNTKAAALVFGLFHVFGPHHQGPGLRAQPRRPGRRI